MTAADPWMTWPGRSLADVVRVCVPRWTEAADDADRFTVAAALLDGVADGDFDPVARARLLLLADRPAEGLAVLYRQGIDELPAEPTDSMPALVLAAHRAAAGDDDAYRWLAAAASGSLHGRPVPYLLGAVADSRGDKATADRVWINLSAEYEVRTAFVVWRFVAATTAQRPRRDARLAARVLVNVTLYLDVLDPDVTHDPSPVLHAATEIHGRDDPAGARLLLHGVSGRLPGVPALEAALRALSPTAATRRHRARLAVARLLYPFVVLTAVAAAVPYHPVPGMVVAAASAAVVGTEAFLRVRVPGLTVVDSRVWRALRVLRANPGIGIGGQSVSRQRVGLYGPLLLTALLLYVVPTRVLAGRVVDMIGTAPLAVRVVVHTIVVVGLITGMFAASNAAFRALDRRSARRNRQRLLEQRLSAATTCQCTGALFHTGRFAEAYRERHLVPVPAPEPTGNAVVDGGELRACPTTGYLWLATRVGDQRTTVLLRGSDGRPAPG